MKKICLAVFFAVVLGWLFQPCVHAQSFEDLLKMIDGRRYTAPSGMGDTSYIDVDGRFFALGLIDHNTRLEYPRQRFKITGHKTVISARTIDNTGVEVTYTISGDGERITEQNRYSDNSPTRNRTFLRQW